MMDPFVIVDEIGLVVSKVEIAILSKLQVYDSKIQRINYQYGHPKEIMETLTQDTKGAGDPRKYPLIALFQDFPETKGMIGLNGEATLHIVIARRTVNTYLAKDRYEKNFKPILLPVYYEFMRQISRHKAFFIESEETLSHTKIDRLYWGKNGLFGNEGNTFNDYIDCIELQNLKIKVKSNTNC